MVEREALPGEYRPSCCVCGERVGRQWKSEALSNGRRWAAYCLADAIAMAEQAFQHNFTEGAVSNGNAGEGEGKCNAKNRGNSGTAS